MSNIDYKKLVAKFKGQALNYNVVIVEVEVGNVSVVGLDFSNEAAKNDKQKTGVIVSVGLSCPKKDMGIFKKIFNFFFNKYNLYTISPGELVMFDKHKSSSLTVDGESYMISYYADIVMKF